MNIAAKAALIIAGFIFFCFTAFAAPQDNDNLNSPGISSVETQENFSPDPAIEQTEDADTPVPDEYGFYEGIRVYVSDNNRILTRSGPGRDYRIIGTKKIGEELTFMGYSQSREYVRLMDSENRVVWMERGAVQTEKCGYLLVEDLRLQIADLQYRLDNYDSALARELNQAKIKLERLEKENAGMSAAIAKKDETIAQLDEIRRDYADRLETRELDMQMRWWLQGAVIAFAGAVAGIVLIYLPRPNRRTRRERY